MKNRAREAHALSKTVSFRLADADYRCFAEKAVASGMTEADFFRSCVMENRTEVIRLPKIDKDQKTILSALCWADRRLEELARIAARLEKQKTASSEECDQLLASLVAVEAYLAGVLTHAC